MHDNDINILVELLREYVLTVTFTKTNGELRKMKCTLRNDIIPEDNKPKGSTKEKSSEVTAVFDVEKQAWRSFRNDSVVCYGV